MVKFCSLFSGSSGNCVFLSSGETKLLIDAGLSGKRIIEAMISVNENPANLSGIMISHEHTDHTKGAGILSRKFNVPIYANQKTWEAIKKDVGEVAEENRRVFETEQMFEIGDIKVNPFAIPHDAIEPVGYNFFIDGRKITTATDIGHMNNRLVNFFLQSDILFLESNHDVEMLKIGPYPWHLKKRIMGEFGHLSNEMAGKVVAYLAKKGTKHFFLGHLSKENNFPELVFQTVSNILAEQNICIYKDIQFEVALRDKVGTVVCL